MTGLNETELRKFQMRSMEEFEDYLVEKVKKKFHFITILNKLFLKKEIS
jgi:hypothetical protein